MGGPNFLGATESFKIDLNGSHYFLNGKVGIGTSGPAEALHLYTPTGSVRQVIETAAADGSEVRLDLKRGAAAGWANVLFLTGSTLEWTIGLRAGDSGLQFHDETGSVVRMYLGTDGKVGIGTTSPAEALHLYTPSGSIRERIETAAVDGGEVRLDLKRGSAPGGANVLFLTGATLEWAIGLRPNDSGLQFHDETGQMVRLYIGTDGNVGIGTTSPTARLDVSGDVAIPNFGSGAAYRARRVDGAIKPLLFVQNDADLADATRLRSAGSGVAIQSDAGANLVLILNGGDVKLNGPLAQIHGRTLVGLAANANNDLIHNLNGNVYWMKGTQGGGAQAGGTQLMCLRDDGALLLGTTPRVVIDSGGYALYG